MKTKHLLSLKDWSPSWTEGLFQTARRLKRTRRPRTDLAGKTLGLLFAKPSTRTRISFEVAMTELGGAATFMQASEVGLGVREEVRDVARTLSRYLSGIVVRAHAQRIIEELARYSRIPVINGLSDTYHPCQALADLFTIWERKGRLKGIKLAYVGDGNNVLHSLLLAGSQLGLSMRVASPKGYGPKPAILATARKQAAKSGGLVQIGRDPVAAVKGADIVYTDVWTSMGCEDEEGDRKKVFRPYQVNNRLVSKAARGALIMHCLPAHRGEEITASVIDSRQSIVFDQAENRLHVQKAILLSLLK